MKNIIATPLRQGYAGQESEKREVKSKGACPAHVLRSLGVAGKLQRSPVPDGTGRSRGFTMVETLFAIFILVLSITGPMTAAQNSLKASFLARDQVVAFYLAQDAIETFKNHVQQNMIDNLKKTNGNSSRPLIESNVFGFCSPPAPCEIDTTKSTNSALPSFVKKCSVASGCEPLKLLNNQYVWNNSSNGTLTKFTREIYLEKINGEYEYKMTVVVRWQSNFFAERRIVVQENFYNWLGN